MLLPRWTRSVAVVFLGLAGALATAKLRYGISPACLELPVFALHSAYFRTRSFVVLTTNLTEEFALALALLGLYALALSREAVESAKVERLRLRAAKLALCLNGCVTLIAIFTVFGTSFIYVLVGQLYTIPLFYVVAFRSLMSIRLRATAHAKADAHLRANR